MSSVTSDVRFLTYRTLTYKIHIHIYISEEQSVLLNVTVMAILVIYCIGWHRHTDVKVCLLRDPLSAVHDMDGYSSLIHATGKSTTGPTCTVLFFII